MESHQPFSAEEQLSHDARLFLARFIELAERINNAVQHHPDLLEGLYSQRLKLFRETTPELTVWLESCRLSPSESWETLRTFLYSVEEEHVKRQYAAKNQPLAPEQQKPKKLNPFITWDDEVEDKAAKDREIKSGQLSRMEVMEMMANLSLKKLREFILLAKGIGEGGIWDHKYDL